MWQRREKYYLNIKNICIVNEVPISFAFLIVTDKPETGTGINCFTYNREVKRYTKSIFYCVATIYSVSNNLPHFQAQQR